MTDAQLSNGKINVGQSAVDQTQAGQSNAGQPVQPKAKPAQTPVSGSLFKEGEPRVIEQKEFVVPQEVKPWVEKVPKEEIHLPQPVKDEYGEILLEAAMPSKPQITLPLDDKTIKKPPVKGITASLTWLIAWCKRLIKKMILERIYRGPNR